MRNGEEDREEEEEEEEANVEGDERDGEEMRCRRGNEGTWEAA